MVKAKLVGYEVFTSKKGNLCVSISVIKPLERRDSHTECVGQKAVSYFVPDNCKGKVSSADVGKDINIYVAYYNGQENLVDIIK